jgi:nucleoid-associated protein YgaU
MTKENKIALVVGFALILIVGILISDHLSTARSQEPADLVAGRGEPLLVENGAASPSHLLFPPRDEPGPDAFAPGPASAAAGFVDPWPGIDESRAASPPPATAPLAATASDPGPATTFHTIKPGESLIAICQQHYGDGALARELARFNKVGDPDRVMAGIRLRLPAADVLRPGSQPPHSAGPARAAAADGPTYTVKSGDALSVIAQKLLGTSRRWREIYDLNRDRIADPDHLLAGTVLRIPP